MRGVGVIGDDAAATSEPQPPGLKMDYGASSENTLPGCWQTEFVSPVPRCVYYLTFLLLIGPKGHSKVAV